MGMSAFEVVPEETVSRELCGGMHKDATHTRQKSVCRMGHDHFQHINHHCIRRNAPLPHGRDALLSLACLPRRAPRCALARPAGSAARATAGCTYIRVAKGAARTSSHYPVLLTRQSTLFAHALFTLSRRRFGR